MILKVSGNNMFTEIKTLIYQKKKRNLLQQVLSSPKIHSMIQKMSHLLLYQTKKLKIQLPIQIDKEEVHTEVIRED